MALVLSLMMVILLAALAGSVMVTTAAEMKISGGYANSLAALYAADAALETAIGELLLVPDWNQVLGGTVTSPLADGPPGPRELADGARIDLGEAAAYVRCGRPGRCSDADVVTMTIERPWGANNPRWQRYISAPLGIVLPNAHGPPRFYVVVWAADDAAEIDGDPVDDENGIIVLRAQAYGPRGVLRTLEAAVSRVPVPAVLGGGTAGIRQLSWREVW
jgi:hypothetical protein